MPPDDAPRRLQPDPPDILSAAPLDELELAYQRALAAVDAIEAALPAELAGQDGAISDTGPDAFTSVSPGEAHFAQAPASERPAGDGPPSSQSVEGSVRIQPSQVIEAALFVGGEPLTARKLCGLLRGDSDHESVDRTVESLNERYAAQGRPYVLRLVEGGYRLELRSEFESVRNRVFGYGPQEVRLSQEALETLAVVAYRQPVARQQVEQILGRPASGILNQLLRRELISLERGDGSPAAVIYRTTPRFLELFGLGGIHELPQADDLSFK